MDAEETRLYYIFCAGLVLITAVTWLLLRMLVRSHNRTLALVRSQLDLQVKKADEDRMHIVSDLHDDIGPYLSALSQKIDLMQNSPEKSTTLLEEAASITGHIIHKTRSITKMLMPYSVRNNNLTASIKDFIARLQADKLKVLFSHNSVPLLQQEHTIAVCRLVQEIIHNSIKHSTARQLYIDLRYEAYVLTISTAETGHLRPAGKKNSSLKPGIGTQLMESRIRLLQGNLHINVSETYGTRYVITIPLPYKIHFNEPAG